MASTFVGRATELALLLKRVRQVERTGEGTALALRGRRQVGKSRLVQEFCDRAAVPYLYYSAVQGASTAAALADFHREFALSGLAADPAVLPEAPAASWQDALRTLAAALPQRPCIVVLDEVPWISEQDRTFDSALQHTWDRLLSMRPVVLVLLGSDLHMMERMTAYDRPFHGRAAPLHLGPLTVADTADLTGLGATDAIDAHLVSGGLPGVLGAWPRGVTALDHLREECADPAAPVFTVPEGTLLSEFPDPTLAAQVLRAIGGGERTGATIAAAVGGAGGVPSGSLTPALRMLVERKQVVTVSSPLSTAAGKPKLHRVADSGLRLYLAVLAQAHALSRRGRAEAAYAHVERQWTSWRGRAVEPLVRESVELACATGALPWPEAATVGGWWNRAFDPEIDLVGADRGPVARSVLFTGSVKWLGTPVDGRDVAALHRGSAAVPGVEPGRTGTLVVSRSGRAAGLGDAGIDAWWGPQDVVAAWRP